MKFFVIAKKLSKVVLPESTLNFIKKRHYLNVIKEFKIENEIDLKVIKHLVSKGDVTLDIGANIGVYSKYLSKYVGEEGIVNAFEPISITYSFLTHNIKSLNIKNVLCHNIALSDEPGETLMEIPSVIAGENFFRARIISSGYSDKKYKTFKVIRKTLDSFTEIEKNNISFIKCDVEGHELEVLKGSKNTIEESKCSLLLEINDDPVINSKANAVVQFLTNLGYRSFWFDGVNLREYKKGDSSVNYFFLLDKHLDKLKKAGLKIILAK